jgi:GlpG protein
MRTIGNLDSKDTAERFRDYLYAQAIEAQIEAEEDGTFSIWILDDDQLSRAAGLLRKFREIPQAIDFQEAAAAARRQREAEARAERQRRSTVVDSARMGYERHFAAMPYVTYALIAISIAVAFYSFDFQRMAANRAAPVLDWLRISQHVYFHSSGESLNLFTQQITSGFLPEVRSGQVWRLLTPIFIHFTIIHILFNMWVLKDIGTIIESRFGGLYMALLVIATGVLSNFGQALWGTPLFGGMSGVNYALLGFVWIRGRYDPASGMELHKSTVQSMLVWYVLCFTGLLGHIANTAHTVGLLAGMSWGWLSAKRRTRFSR